MTTDEQLALGYPAAQSQRRAALCPEALPQP